MIVNCPSSHNGTPMDGRDISDCVKFTDVFHETSEGESSAVEDMDSSGDGYSSEDGYEYEDREEGEIAGLAAQAVFHATA